MTSLLLTNPQCARGSLPLHTRVAKGFDDDFAESLPVEEVSTPHCPFALATPAAPHFAIIAIVTLDQQLHGMIECMHAWTHFVPRVAKVDASSRFAPSRRACSVLGSLLCAVLWLESPVRGVV
jgi:hypothetical protein